MSIRRVLPAGVRAGAGRTVMWRVLMSMAVLSPSPSLVAASPAQAPQSEQAGVTVRAVRLPEALDLDGELDEAVYGTVPPLTAFIQQVPQAGLPATEKTAAESKEPDRVRIPLSPPTNTPTKQAISLLPTRSG
jgi:hypothetical protein